MSTRTKSLVAVAIIALLVISASLLAFTIGRSSGDDSYLVSTAYSVLPSDEEHRRIQLTSISKVDLDYSALLVKMTGPNEANVTWDLSQATWVANGTSCHNEHLNLTLIIRKPYAVASEHYVQPGDIIEIERPAGFAGQQWTLKILFAQVGHSILFCVFPP